MVKPVQQVLLGRRRHRHQRKQFRRSDQPRQLEEPLEEQLDGLLAKPFVKGHELTVAVLDDEALAVTELKPKVGFYDYDAKYTDGLTEHVCPAQVPDGIAQAMMDMAVQGASAARLPRSLAVRLPLGRRAGRSRHFSFGSQHSTRNDPLEPCAGAGEGAWHRLRYWLSG